MAFPWQCGWPEGRTTGQGKQPVIDLHLHILPGMDDGPRNLQDSLAMARLAVQEGIKTAVATPHLFRRRWVDPADINLPEAIKEQVAALNLQLRQEGIDLTVLPGCEAPLFPELLSYLADKKILTLNDNGRYLSLEMPETIIPPAIEHLIFELGCQGLTPVLSHPERNPVFYHWPEKLERLVSLGCLVQITAMSLTRGFGWRVARFSKKLLKRGLVQVVATDAHNLSQRPPLLREALERLCRLLGESRAWDLVSTNPEKIIRGETL